MNDIIKMLPWWAWLTISGLFLLQPLGLIFFGIKDYVDDWIGESRKRALKEWEGKK